LDAEGADRLRRGPGRDRDVDPDRPVLLAALDDVPGLQEEPAVRLVLDLELVDRGLIPATPGAPFPDDDRPGAEPLGQRHETPVVGLAALHYIDREVLVLEWAFDAPVGGGPSRRAAGRSSQKAAQCRRKNREGERNGGSSL